MAEDQSNLSEGDLERYLQNESDDNTRQAVENSTELTELVADMRALSAFLKNQFYREDCPSTMALGEFHLGLSSPQEAAFTQAHLKQCPYCARELIGLQRELGESLIPSTKWERLKIFLADQLSNLSDLGIGPSPSAALALRGHHEQEESKSHTFQLGPTSELSLFLEPDTEEAKRYLISGLIMDENNETFTLFLWKDDEIYDTISIRSGGNFELSNLEQGDYELVVQGDNILVHIPKITLID